MQPQVVAAALLDQRQRPLGQGQAGQRGQLGGHQGVGQRQRHLPMPDGAQHLEAMAPGLAQAACGLAGQHPRVAALDHAPPQRGVDFARLGALAQAAVHVVGKQPADAAGDELGVAVHRSPRPRAMMPRRISRVPPRSENEGTASVACSASPRPVGCRARHAAEQRVRDVGHRLLDQRALVLDQRGGQGRVLARASMPATPSDICRSVP
jgi:hypothetical protein